MKSEKSKKIHDTEVKLILSILNETKWNRRRAAEVLGISYSTLRRKIEKYEMDIGMKQFSDGDAAYSKPADMLPRQLILSISHTFPPGQVFACFFAPIARRQCLSIQG